MIAPAVVEDAALDADAGDLRQRWAVDGRCRQMLRAVDPDSGYGRHQVPELLHVGTLLTRSQPYKVHVLRQARSSREGGASEGEAGVRHLAL